MKTIISPILILTAILVICKNPLLAQDDKRFNFIGINPSVTVEPFYDKGEFDINIFPIVYQRSLTKRLDIRLTSISWHKKRRKRNKPLWF